MVFGNTIIVISLSYAKMKGLKAVKLPSIMSYLENKI